MRKKFSLQEKIKYHRRRDRDPSLFGLKNTDPKRAYSDGFVDGIDSNRNDRNFYKNFAGLKAANAYSFGRARGRKIRFNK